MILAALITLLVVIWLTDAAFERAQFPMIECNVLPVPDAWLTCMRTQHKMQEEIRKGYCIRPKHITVEYDVAEEIRFEFE